MSFAKLLFAAGLFCGSAMSMAETPLGARGPESDPARRQEWLIPGPGANGGAHALLYRPAGNGPFPIAIVAAATAEKATRHALVPARDYRTLANWLVERGYAVLVTEPARLVSTGAKAAKDAAGCDDARYLRAGGAMADSIRNALNYMRDQTFVRADGDLVIGHSDGGWGALALAGRDVPGVAAVVVFAPGLSARSNEKTHQACGPQRLVSAATELGKDAHLPVVWIVARNDTQFTPAQSRQMADAFRAGGDKVDFRDLPDFRSDGHALAEADGGDELYGATLDSALKAILARPVRKR